MATRKKATRKTADQLPAEQVKNEMVVSDYGTDAGMGVDDIDQSEAGIPFLKLLQAQSPEVQGPNGKIDGAKAGDILNGGTGELTSGVRFVPAVRQHVWVSWRPRKQGGGMVAQYQPDDPVVLKAQAEQQFGDYKDPDGNDLMETFYLFGVVLDGENNPVGMAVAPFSSTAIKAYKKQFAQRVYYCMVKGPGGRMIKPPMFAHSLELRTVQQTNDKGTWFNWDIRFLVDNDIKASLLPADSAAYQAAKSLAEAVRSGETQADTSTASRDAAGDGADPSAF